MHKKPTSKYTLPPAILDLYWFLGLYRQSIWMGPWKVTRAAPYIADVPVGHRVYIFLGAFFFMILEDQESWKDIECDADSKH